jgi:hypothetical protein
MCGLGDLSDLGDDTFFLGKGQCHRRHLLIEWKLGVSLARRARDTELIGGV